MGEKYKFTGKTKELSGHILHQIQALKDTENADEGEIGGWIEKESNLSQKGEAWVSGNSCVYENAVVEGDACTMHDTEICGESQIYGKTLIMEKAKVCGKSRVCGHAVITDRATVQGQALICEHSEISGKASVGDEASVSGKSRICENASIRGKSMIHDSYIAGESQVCGNILLSNAVLLADADVSKHTDYLTVQGLYLSKHITFFKRKNGEIGTVGRPKPPYTYIDNIERYKRQVMEDCKDNEKLKTEFLLLADLAKAHIQEDE